MGMRELVNFAELGFEDVNGTVITTRSFILKTAVDGERIW